MATLVNRHNSKWITPSPFWKGLGKHLQHNSGRDRFNRPAILRFRTDAFMDELLSLMTHHPEKLPEWEAQPENWREPMPEPPTAKKLSVREPISFFAAQQKRDVARRSGFSEETGETQSQDVGLLKLYQPAQQRFYLITAAFVCRRRGLPDRAMRLNKQERPSFVVRRIIPDSLDTQTKLENGEIDFVDGEAENCTEYAFVNTESGSRWRPMAAQSGLPSDRMVPNEERFPMFNLVYNENDGYERKIFSGLIPVGKREAFLGAGLYAGSSDIEENEEAITTEKKAAIKSLLSQQVAAPWKQMITQTNNDAGTIEDPGVYSAIERDFRDSNSPGSTGNVGSVLNSREQVQSMSWYVLLDLANFLKRYLNDFWKFIHDGDFSVAAINGLSQAEKTIYYRFREIKFSAGETLDNELLAYFWPNQVMGDLILALEKIIVDPDDEKNLEDVEVQFRMDKNPPGSNLDDINQHNLWPRWVFPLADIAHPDEVFLPNSLVPPDTDESVIDAYEVEHLKVDTLMDLIVDAINIQENTFIPESGLPKNVPQLNARDGWFVIRCVYETPNCGPFHPAILSAPSRLFSMASFFDSDAPGRPVRIPMPMDISPAGLRKYSRNTTFMISDALCGKIKGIRKITLGDLVLSVLPWPFHKDLPDISKMGPCKEGGSGFGMFCSLSIPIVTLCAMILLIIMVALLDFIFRWIPLLFVCLPIPGLKGKKS